MPDHRIQVPFRVEPETFDLMERLRGDVPRQRWLERAVHQRIARLMADKVTLGSTGQGNTLTISEEDRHRLLDGKWEQDGAES